MKNKLFISFIIGVVFLALPYYIYQSNLDEKIIKQLSLQKAKYQFEEKDVLLTAFINKFAKTLIGVKENKNFIQFLNNKKDDTDINELFLSIIKSFPGVVQFRYIDNNGDEIIRVDKNIDKYSYIIPKQKLQNKKNRYYFNDIINTQNNKIWYSKLDLNIEHGKIVKPIQPTLRVGTVIISDNIKRGILIINIDMTFFLNKLLQSHNFNIYLIDNQGNFLMHKDSKYSWSKYLNININVFKNFKNFKTEMFNSKETFAQDYFISKTAFENDDHLMIIIEPVKSSIIEDIKQRTKTRIYWILSALLIIISIGYILFNRRHVKLVERYSNKLLIEKQNIQNILNSQKSIVILSNGTAVYECNKRFLEFFGYETLDQFTVKHDCICDFFEQDEQHQYMQKTVEDTTWAEYVLSHQDKIHKVKMTGTDNKKYIFQVYASIYKSTDDKIKFVITFSDITQIESLNDDLNEKTKEQNILLSLFDKGESVLFKWNNDEKWSVDYVSTSVKRLLGYQIDDFYDHHITYSSCIHPDDLESVISEVTKAGNDNADFFKHHPYRIITKDNQIKWVIDYTIIVRNKHNVITHYVGYINDITEEKEQEKRLFEQEKMTQMREMIGNIAHQWRQPLSVISTVASGIQLKHELGILDNDDMSSNMDMIVTNTDFLSKTIDTFSDFIKEKREFKEVILQEQIDNTLKILSSALVNNHIKLINNIQSENNIKITMTTGELSQVLINILDNAKDILIEKGTKDRWIKLELEQKDNKAIISIEDNAGGIPEDILPKIFDPYFTTKHQSQGTGLGLHMCQTIIRDSLKGELYAKNTANGAKFIIELPLT
ncbi:MAG: PAS domain-containing protein [Arcobacteraceae bacterium]|nr:PAS domain-containing protein [Arcobacteraceae bacterium]